ncbi:unnamed protein product (macronuclear) [Paramecium tetraurelia]|uniref:Uncharacterized protein n=1 Tax=Paramecium tetraurelia TaxID=5888 RepID=A0BPP9_PARTE|nr:uncharacterized protein GSPATT00005266001 [Paramecium tetraurelia]CAK60516.1 unnamed protein product [Paramecium tetraurelia]|eukprot:XP_001427914.1 hypothetical protein (macronuclear) [Paramecium tetraurelia strain d4-2]
MKRLAQKRREPTETTVCFSDLKTEPEELKQQDKRLKNWNNMFGNFLGEGLVRQKKKNKHLDPVFLKEAPLYCGNNLYDSPSVRDNFEKFIEGEITACEFLARKNQSELLDRQRPTSPKKIRLFRVENCKNQFNQNNQQTGFLKLLKDKTEEVNKQFRIQSRFAVLRNLIEHKIKMKEEEDIIKRSRELKNVGVIKQMYDISDEYIKLIERRFMEKRSTPVIIKNQVNGYQIKLIQHQNPYQILKTASYENETKNKYEPPTQTSTIKFQIDQKAQQYIEELQTKNCISNEKAKKKIFFNSQYKNVVHKQSQSLHNLRNVKSVVPFVKQKYLNNQYINNDLELIKYITDYQVEDPFHDKQIQSKIRKSLLISAGIVPNHHSHKNVQKANKQTYLNIKDQLSQKSSQTIDDSLNSMYEFNVDSLYNQSIGLQNKLLGRQHDGFSKTIKSIQKNESLKKEIIIKNIQKLEGLEKLKITE